MKPAPRPGPRSPSRPAYDGRWGTGRRLSRAGNDMGSGSVYVLALTLVVALTGSAATLLTSAVATRHRAAAAADLAALAAAAAAPTGAASACRRAATVAAAGGATLTGCSLLGAVAQVSVAMTGRGPLAGFGPARARARAGPADVPPGSDPPSASATEEAAPLLLGWDIAAGSGLLGAEHPAAPLRRARRGASAAPGPLLLQLTLQPLLLRRERGRLRGAVPDDPPTLDPATPGPGRPAEQKEQPQGKDERGDSPGEEQAADGDVRQRHAERLGVDMCGI